MTGVEVSEIRMYIVLASLLVAKLHLIGKMSEAEASEYMEAHEKVESILCKYQEMPKEVEV